MCSWPPVSHRTIKKVGGKHLFIWAVLGLEGKVRETGRELRNRIARERKWRFCAWNGISCDSIQSMAERRQWLNSRTVHYEIKSNVE